MSSKTVTILGGILVLLLALVGLQFWGPSAFTPKESPYKAAVKAVNAENIDTITITKQSQSIALKQEGGVWNIDGKAAAKDKIDQLFTQFINDPVAQEIAQTNTRHKELEVTDDLATGIQFSDKLTILTGKSAGDGVYVRVKGSDAVYLLTNASPSPISTVASDWQDKTIVKIEESAINKLMFTKPVGSFTLIKENGTWKVEGPAAFDAAGEGEKEIDPSAIGALMSDLSSFQARSLADEKTAAAYPASSILTLTIEHTDGKETLEFFGGTTEYLVKRTSDNERFIIAEFQAKHFLINQTEIVKKEPTVGPNPT